MSPENPWAFDAAHKPWQRVVTLTLYVLGGGTLDGMNLIKVPDFETMRNDLTDLRSFTMLEGVGHWPQFEARDATNAVLLAFLQSL